MEEPLLPGFHFMCEGLKCQASLLLQIEQGGSGKNGRQNHDSSFPRSEANKMKPLDILQADHING